jgi:hypothetical protein
VSNPDWDELHRDGAKGLAWRVTFLDHSGNTSVDGTAARNIRLAHGSTQHSDQQSRRSGTFVPIARRRSVVEFIFFGKTALSERASLTSLNQNHSLP